MTAEKPSDQKRRAERLAAALKANLKRRKAQARGRAGAEESVAPAPQSDDRDRPDGGQDR
jgi:hypothetical protein